MKLWHLYRTDVADYDEDRALIVRATSAKAARKMAAESHKSFGDKATSTCERITEQGDACIILADNVGS